MNATKTGGILIAYTALLYLYGVSAFWLFIGVGLGFLIFIPFAKKLRRLSKDVYYTLGDYLRHGFSERSAKLGSLINIIMMIGFFVASLVGSAKVINLYAGIDFTVATIGTSAVVLVYLLLAGFNAVVRTDILQYGIIVFILSVFAAVLISGDTFAIGEIDMFQAGAGNVIGFLLIGVIFPFSSPDLWQRVYAMKDEVTVGKSIFYSIVIYVAVAVILTLIGLAIKAALPDLDPDIAIIEGFTQLLPVGFGGLAVIVFFGAFMSSMDTYAFTASSSFVQDYLSKRLSKAEIVRLTRWFLAVMVVLCTIVALLLQSVVLTTYIFVAFAAVLAVPVIASWIRPKMKTKTMEWSLIVGLVLLVVFGALEVASGGITSMMILKGIISGLVGLGVGAAVANIRTKATSL